MKTLMSEIIKDKEDIEKENRINEFLNIIEEILLDSESEIDIPEKKAS
ncbi:hypothetical protein [Dethiothermospora halolimnae]